MKFKNKKTGAILVPTSPFVIEQMKKHTYLYVELGKAEAKPENKETKAKGKAEAKPETESDNTEK